MNIKIIGDITQEKILDVYEEIDEFVVNREVVLKTRNKNNVDTTLCVTINSHGGDSLYALFLYDYLRSLRDCFEIETVALAECKSAAVTIFCAGTVKSCYNSTEFLIHPASMIIDENTISNTECIIAMQRDMERRLIDIYNNNFISEKFNITDIDNFNKEWYFDGSYCRINNFKVQVF